MMMKQWLLLHRLGEAADDDDDIYLSTCNEPGTVLGSLY